MYKSDGSCWSGMATVGGMKKSDLKGTVVGVWLLSLKLRLVVRESMLLRMSAASTVDMCLRLVLRGAILLSRLSD